MNSLKLYFLREWLTEYLINIRHSLVSLSIDLEHADLSEEESVHRLAKYKEYSRLESKLSDLIKEMNYE